MQQVENDLFIYINNHFKCEWLNTPIKRQRLSRWIKKTTTQHSTIYYNKYTSTLKTQDKSKGIEKDISY